MPDSPREKRSPLDVRSQTIKHIDFCRDTERLSYQDLDKLKLSMPALLFATVTYLAGRSSISGAPFTAAAIATGVCVGTTALSMWAAAHANRDEYIEALRNFGIKPIVELNWFEKALARSLGFFNATSLLASLLGISFVVWLLITQPPEPKGKPNEVQQTATRSK